jgi:hypothetical protein
MSMTAFTLASLLKLFAIHCSETGVAEYPFSPEILALVAKTPNDPATYVRIAEDAFAQYLLGSEIPYDEFGCAEAEATAAPNKETQVRYSTQRRARLPYFGISIGGN